MPVRHTISINSYPENDMHVYVVWEPVLGGDGDRARQATATIGGPDVIHYWDSAAASGSWFAENMPWDHGDGPAWDVFYVFGADATWTAAPEPVNAWGYTIVGQRDALKAGLEEILS